MLPIIIIALVAGLLIAYILFKPRWVESKRNKIRGKSFPKPWRDILRRNVPYFYMMPVDLQLQLKKHVMVFLEEKQFYGFEGIEITDEIKVTIAAQACLLLLNRNTNYYPKLKSIYVYPAAFIAQQQSQDAAGVLQNHHRVLSGESWELGKVILSWKDTREGALVLNDGHNVVIHEFAHQLDQETGIANGAPFLARSKHKNWSHIFNEEFNSLHRAIASGEETLLDRYGATNPAEFFAVASEVFFERPIAMLQQHPKLYNQLAALYQVNPAIW